MKKSEYLLPIQADWEIWYQDTFDQDCPRQLELTGCGLITGLIELWARHLYETVQPNGVLGFSHFNLWWKQRRCSIEVVGEAAGQVKIRNWVFGQRCLNSSSFLDVADTSLLKSICEIHAELVLRGQTSEEIILIAHLLNDRQNFIEQIIKL